MESENTMKIVAQNLPIHIRAIVMEIQKAMYVKGLSGSHRVYRES